LFCIWLELIATSDAVNIGPRIIRQFQDPENSIAGVLAHENAIPVFITGGVCFALRNQWFLCPFDDNGPDTATRLDRNSDLPFSPHVRPLFLKEYEF
jgi:hypothetical protein